MRKLAFLAAALAFSGSALAGGRVAIGIGIGFPIYPYPAPVVIPAPAPVVVSRPVVRYTERREPASTDWWYYCAQSRGYYPYVRSCPSGWQKISPTPAG